MRAWLLLALVLASVWLLRGLTRRKDDLGANRTNRSVGAPTPMVRCAQCGVHLPENLARPLPQGGLGCPEHTQADDRA
ncbi:MAG: hypothetical protein OHK0048_02470 [Rhodoferax sp.]